jgi:hypothetical protein
MFACLHALYTVALSTWMVSCFACGCCRQTVLRHLATVLVFVACQKESQSDRHCLAGSFQLPVCLQMSDCCSQETGPYGFAYDIEESSGIVYPSL